MSFEVKQEDIYTWPNPAFPFSCIFNGEECRIFFIENISHNYKWLELYQDKIKDNDYFFVVLGWNFSDHLAKHAVYTLDKLNLNKDNFFIFHNSPQEESTGKDFGFSGAVVNHNAWLNTHTLKPLNTDKKYDALYIARPVKFKRHYLASKVEKLALAAGGDLHKDEVASLPHHINDGSQFYDKLSLAKLINSSHCGLVLSYEEGACYSSSEYLLCGTPVVSTKSLGGRDVWYNQLNSIICDDDPDSVAEAVNLAKSKSWNKKLIREMHMEQAKAFKKIALQRLQVIFKKHYKSINIDAEEILNNLRWYCNPNSNGCVNINDLQTYFK